MINGFLDSWSLRVSPSILESLAYTAKCPYYVSGLEKVPLTSCATPLMTIKRWFKTKAFICRLRCARGFRHSKFLEIPEALKKLTKYWRWPYFRITVHEKLRTLLTLRPSQRKALSPSFETENAQWINIYGKKNRQSRFYSLMCEQPWFRLSARVFTESWADYSDFGFLKTLRVSHMI